MRRIEGLQGGRYARFSVGLGIGSADVHGLCDLIDPACVGGQDALGEQACDGRLACLYAVFMCVEADEAC